MKRYLLIPLILLILLTGCVQQQNQHICENNCDLCSLCIDYHCQEAACAEKCQGHHDCANPCIICSRCTNAECAEIACNTKCQGHTEQMYVFPSGDYLTESETHIDTGILVFDLGEHIYVRGNLEELAEKTTTSIEAVTGLDFDTAGVAHQVFPDGKIHVNISWKQVRPGTAAPFSDLGDAWTELDKHVYLSPGDLYVGNGCVIVHELCHMLQFCQSGWFHSPLLNEGFAEYTSYLVLRDMEENDPAMMLDVGSANQILISLNISDYDTVYRQPLESWLQRKYGDENYTIGFRFMAYLHDVYGDYTRWIAAYESAYPYLEKTGYSDVAPQDQEIAVLKAVYGEDVLDGFYPWLKEHEASFAPVLPSPTDLQRVSCANWYPIFGMQDSMAEITGLSYQDLYLNLSAMRKYLAEYKGLNGDDLSLLVSEAVQVYLYRADGSYTAVCTTDPIDLDGIVYIKLVGAGQLDYIRIDGSFCMHWE